MASNDFWEAHGASMTSVYSNVDILSHCRLILTRLVGKLTSLNDSYLLFIKTVHISKWLVRMDNFIYANWLPTPHWCLPASKNSPAMTINNPTTYSVLVWAVHSFQNNYLGDPTGGTIPHQTIDSFKTVTFYQSAVWPNVHPSLHQSVHPYIYSSVSLSLSLSLSFSLYHFLFPFISLSPPSPPHSLHQQVDFLSQWWPL